MSLGSCLFILTNFLLNLTYTIFMNNKKIAFVFSNQIYYISSENDILTVTTVEGVICLRAAVETLTCNQDPLSVLVLEIYQTLF